MRRLDSRISTREAHRRPERFLVGYGDSGPILYTAPEEKPARRPYTPDEFHVRNFRTCVKLAKNPHADPTRLMNWRVRR